ncbi:hypothetical protein FB451DRAFT_1549580, partial [Mycena latifolia]
MDLQEGGKRKKKHQLNNGIFGRWESNPGLPPRRFLYRLIKESGCAPYTTSEFLSLLRTWVTDAVSLGLLDPTEPYSRKAATNGIILCPTCHLGYFTCGRLVLSPPMPVLEWITGKLKGATDSAAVWQIFSELEFSRSPQLLRYKNHYSLIPFFRSEDKESYELYCNKPTMVVNHDGAYRIFSYKKTHQHRTPVIVRFTSTPPCEGPTDYWYIPVSCHIILYIFLQRAINRVSKSPEVTLARQIYAKLLELRGIPSRATFSIIAVDAEVSFEESSLAGDSVYAEIDTYPNSMDLAGLRPGAMMPAGDNEGGRRRTACGRLAPAHPCCGREHKGNTTHICSVCYTVVRKSIPPEISTF